MCRAIMASYAAALIVLTTLLAAGVAADGAAPDWENQHVLGVAKLPARTESPPYPDRAIALNDDPEANPWRKSLNGKWRFHWAPDPDHRPIRFYETTYDDSNWSDIARARQLANAGLRRAGVHEHRLSIPKRTRRGSWASRRKSYTNYRERNPVGSYRRTFTCPPWDGRQVLLQFDGVDSAFYLWVNGQKAGYSQDSRTPAMFNVTKYLRHGRKLAGRRGLPLLGRQLPRRPGFLAAKRHFPRRVARGPPAV